MSNRRNFLQQFSRLAGTAVFSSISWQKTENQIKDYLRQHAKSTPKELANDEYFWQQIRQAYTVSPTLINLNNGGVSPQPRVVQEAVEFYNRLSNETPTHYMWKVLDRNREALRRNLARFAGCDAEELAIHRNASEAIETVIFGLRLKKGDEIVISRQSYPTVMNAWKQREIREGIRVKWLNFDFPIENEKQIIDTYRQAFSLNTKIVHLTHVINWNGQIMPVQRIAKLAHELGIEVLVDGAHSFAQMDFNIADLGCDYFGTSLHKWMSGPFGSGMLYVKKEKIADLFPLLASSNPQSTDIRKFENLGTRSLAIEYAIGHALQFHEMIGTERKYERLQELKRYWMERLREIPGVQLHSSLDPQFGSGIGLFSIDGYEPADIRLKLEQKHRIHVTAIKWENINGVRVTPNVYTLKSELDEFVDAVGSIANKKY